MENRREGGLPLRTGFEAPNGQETVAIQVIEPSEPFTDDDDDDDEQEVPPDTWRTAWAVDTPRRQLSREIRAAVFRFGGLCAGILIWRYVWPESNGWLADVSFSAIFGWSFFVAIYETYGRIRAVVNLQRESAADIEGVAVAGHHGGVRRFYLLTAPGNLLGPIDHYDCKPSPEHGQRMRIGVWLPSELIHRIDLDDHTADPDCRIYVPPEVMSRVTPTAEPSPAEPAAQAAPPS